MDYLFSRVSVYMNQFNPRTDKNKESHSAFTFIVIVSKDKDILDRNLHIADYRSSAN